MIELGSICTIFRAVFILFMSHCAGRAKSVTKQLHGKFNYPLITTYEKHPLQAHRKRYICADALHHNVQRSRYLVR
jgi:hypothetical protein